MKLSAPLNNAKQMFYVEALTLIAIFALATWSVRPLLEEWGFFQGIAARGLSVLWTINPSIALRPMHLLPYGIVTAIGTPIGVGIGVALLMVARYFAARWAISPYIDGYNRWIISTCAAVLLVWPGAWLGRFVTAQFAAFLFFLTLGCLIRLKITCAKKYSLFAVIFVLWAMLTYQALVIIILATPFFLYLWAFNNKKIDETIRFAEFLRLYFPLIIGFSVYAVYCVAILMFTDAGGYERGLTSGVARLFSAGGIAEHIAKAYNSAYVENKLALPVLALFASTILIANSSPQSSLWCKLRWNSLAYALVISLPLLSIIYTYPLHISDSERVLFPISVGFVMLCITFTKEKKVSLDNNLSSAFVVVIALLIACVTYSVNVRSYWNIQRQVINQLTVLLKDKESNEIILKDMTGVLGDSYTFYNPTLTLSVALATYGKMANITICTPNSVDRLHKEAQRYPLGTTERCEEILKRNGSYTVLIANWNGDHNIQLSYE